MQTSLRILSTDGLIGQRSCVLHLHDEMDISDASTCLYVVESPLYSHHHAHHSDRVMIRQDDPVVFRQYGISGAYLSSDMSNKWADIQKKKTRLGVCGQMQSSTHFRIHSIYETSSEHVIYYQSQVTIRHVSTGLELHAAPDHCFYGNSGAEDYYLTKRVEVNLSQSKTGVRSDDVGSFQWRFKRFDTAGVVASSQVENNVPSKGLVDNDNSTEANAPHATFREDFVDSKNGTDSYLSDAIRVGACVHITNQYANGYLWGSCANAVFESGILQRDHEIHSRTQETSNLLSATGRNFIKSDVIYSPDTMDDKFGIQALFFSKPPEFCLNDHSAEHSPKSIFVIERASCLLGGEIKWDGYYRLRHLVSGCYMSVKQSSSDNFEFYLSSLTKQAVRSKDLSCVSKLQFISSTLFQFDAMVHEEAAGVTVTWNNSTVRLIHRFMKIPPSEVACRLQLQRLLQGRDMEYHLTEPVSLILGVQRPRTMKYCTSVMGSSAAVLPCPRDHRSEMHKVSLFFSKQSSESDIYDIRPVEGQTALLRNIHKIKLIHSILDNFEAALCMFIRGSGGVRSGISDDICNETLAALSTILDFVRGQDSILGSTDYPTFKSLQERKWNQVLCAKLGVVDRLFCILSIPIVMDGMTNCCNDI